MDTDTTQTLTRTGKRTKRSGTGKQTDRERDTNGQGHKRTGIQTDRDWDTNGQGLGQRWTGAGKQTDRLRGRVTDGQEEEHRRTT